ncbi:cysteinyl-tRNA synthetase [Candidatus Mancarchaeum acidiphilum]|uniref:Cysteine--tRNA ligase n=1 Tax=Candidatus Mancarchaeum acidiphilum TaxID=1920749 RepID=A0A218NNV7_9ARCH|nr:cysteine--tRNA ligase [Candidatus Mancarchaeum acidiphilum]ASI14124.1 cysteinyl-tRNA synthetase [Candidatus Mancarchaeum acidiphilum]
MKVYNTLTRSEEEFVPLNDKTVNMFVCGQTPYDDAHLGHARNYIIFDVVARWLRHEGYKVNYVQNITDIDDKIINRAKEQGITAEQLERRYEKRFLEDMEVIGVKKDITKYARSHDYIEAIRQQIQLLLDKGYAYYLDGDIYYDVDKFKDYTKLSGMKLEELKNHRVEPKEGKKNVYDFALWKAAKPGEPKWDIKLNINGKEMELQGRPGWHIEDTAITYTLFGPQYDLHGGASELIFPHHTNEIAQAEAAFGKKPFVRYWLHVGVLNINNVKMSKSLKNFITIRDALAKYDPEALRLLMVSANYRKEINYTEKMMEDSQGKLNYMYNSFSILYNYHKIISSKGSDESNLINEFKKFEKEFTELMNDDFNTSVALMKLIAILTTVRAYLESHDGITQSSKDSLIKGILEYANIFGILENTYYKESIPEGLEDLMKERDRLRKSKNYAEADKIREDIKQRYGVLLEDTEYGTVWYKKRAQESTSA